MSRGGFSQYEDFLNAAPYAENNAVGGMNLYPATAPSSSCFSENTQESNEVACVNCTKPVIDCEASLKFSCSHVAHIKCLNKENLSRLGPDNVCEQCPQPEKPEYTVADMEQYAKDVKKKEVRLKERFKLYFTFDSEYNSLNAFRRRSFLPKNDPTVNIFNVMRQPWDRDFLIKKKITFAHLLKHDVHIQSMYQVLGLKTIQDLIDIGFKNSFIGSLSSDESTCLVPIYDLCMMYKLNFDDLQSEELGGFSPIDLAQLAPSVYDLQALELNAGTLISKWNASKQFFLMMSYIPLSTWALKFGLKPVHLEKIGMQAMDLVQFTPSGEDLQALGLNADTLISKWNARKEFFLVTDQIPLSTWALKFGLKRKHIEKLEMQTMDYRLLGWTTEMRNRFLPKNQTT